MAQIGRFKVNTVQTPSPPAPPTPAPENVVLVASPARVAATPAPENVVLVASPARVAATPAPENVVLVASPARVAATPANVVANPRTPPTEVRGYRPPYKRDVNSAVRWKCDGRRHPQGTRHWIKLGKPCSKCGETTRCRPTREEMTELTWISI